MVRAQYGIAVGAAAFAVYLALVTGGAVWPAVFVALGLLNAGLARFAQVTPVIHVDADGLRIRPALLTRALEASWPEVVRFELPTHGQLEVRTGAGRSARVPLQGLDPEQLHELRTFVHRAMASSGRRSTPP